MKLPFKTYVLGIASGLIYSAFILLSFYGAGHGADTNRILDALYIMSFGFLACVPFAIGWLVIAPLEDAESAQWSKRIFLPWVPVAIADTFLIMIGKEGFICVLFAVPITFLFASLGGISAGLYRAHARKTRATTFCLALLPFLVTFAESRRTAPLEIRPVETSIVIHAPADVVWENIASVRAIAPAELRPTWTHRIGFPRPIAATLDHEGVGGVRKASFEGGVLFTETVTDWQPGKAIAFTIKANTDAIPSTTLDEHVTIGGQYFDVLNGRYTIEQQPNGVILLHLVSNERLSTDFNWYAGLWSDAVMRSLQQSILEVIQHRCEHEASN